jgi:hypothetical protein
MKINMTIMGIDIFKLLDELNKMPSKWNSKKKWPIPPINEEPQI